MNARYVCPHEHAVSVPGDRRQPTRCPVVVNGSPCPGTLTKLAPSSRRVLDIFGPGAWAGALR